MDTVNVFVWVVATFIRVFDGVTVTLRAVAVGLLWAVDVNTVNCL